MRHRSPSIARATTQCATVALLCSSLLAQWERIAPNYHNVRGTNYIPVYEQLHSAPAQPAGYNGVACATAMWRFWSEPGSIDSVNAQLDMIQRAGFNAVRVWMSYPLWWADRDAPSNRMLDAFGKFLTICEERHLYVMPVLWDDHCYGQSPCTPPDYSDPIGLNPPYNNISHWTPNPGQPKIDAFAQVGFQTAEFKDYVRQIAEIGQTSPALLMWDVMNEPAVDATDSRHQRALIARSLELLKAVDPDCVTTVGFIGIIDGEPIADVARNPLLDVISIHPYGSFRESVEVYTRYAAQVLDGNGMEMNKPILLTECGQPGRGQTYQDVLVYSKSVEYGPLSNPTANVGAGFFVFSAMLGWDQGNFPHRDKHGLFYWDGTVRDVNALLAFEQAAIEQGISPHTLRRSYVEKSVGAPGWFEQLPLPHGHNYAQTRLILFLPQWYYAALTPDEGEDFANLFDILGYDAAVVSVGPAPASNVTAQDLQLMELYSTVYRTGFILGQQLTDAQRNLVLDAWRFKLLEHVGGLTGNK